jgi:hypothetical protein
MTRKPEKAAKVKRPPADPLVEWLESMNIPVTRENYINHNWPGDDMPEEWTGEHEAQLPRELQNWTWET